MGVRSTCVATIIVLIAAVCAAPPKPKIADEFVCTADMGTHVSGGSFHEWKNTTYMYSALMKRTTYLGLQDVMLTNPEYTINSTMWWDADSFMYQTNGVCRKYPGTFTDTYGFLSLPGVKFSGSSTVRGRPVNVWNFVMKAGPVFINNTIAVELNDNTRPVQLIAIFGYEPAEFESVQNIYYHPDYTETTPPISEMTPTPNCYTTGRVCAPGPVTTMNFVRYHSKSYYGLDNKNTGDLAGDTYFMCWALSSGQRDPDQLISIFSVKVNTTWGRYGRCMGGSCWGSNSFTVGRAATFTVKPLEGQCEDDSDTGVWYSMSKDAHCPDGAPIGSGGCAWSIVERVKTITMDCLLSRGFLSTCQKYPAMPVPQASALVSAAFAVCPDVKPSPERAQDFANPPAPTVREQTIEAARRQMEQLVGLEQAHPVVKDIARHALSLRRLH